MDIITQYWQPILGLLLSSVLTVAIATFLRRSSKMTKKKHLIIRLMTATTIISSIALSMVVLSCGGGMDIILPLLLIPLLVSLLG